MLEGWVLFILPIFQHSNIPMILVLGKGSYEKPLLLMCVYFFNNPNIKFRHI